MAAARAVVGMASGVRTIGGLDAVARLVVLRMVPPACMYCALVLP